MTADDDLHVGEIALVIAPQDMEGGEEDIKAFFALKATEEEESYGLHG